MFIDTRSCRSVKPLVVIRFTTPSLHVSMTYQYVACRLCVIKLMVVV